MADNVAINQGVGTTIATDERNSAHEQIVIATSFIQTQKIIPVINTSAYATGDCLGGLQEITNFSRYTAGAGRLLSVTLLDDTQAQRAAVDLVFFSQSVTVAGNNSPIATSDADMIFCLGVVAIATGDYNTAWPGTPLNSIATKKDINLVMIPAATSIFVQAVVRGTPTYTAADDLHFHYTWEQL